VQLTYVKAAHRMLVKLTPKGSIFDLPFENSQSKLDQRENRARENGIFRLGQRSKKKLNLNGICTVSFRDLDLR
jgi:hypothetical protein